MRVAIITVSDSRAREMSRGSGKADAASSGPLGGAGPTDTSGDAIVEWVTARRDVLVSRSVVADDTSSIVRSLLQSCDRDAVDLVLTTGGTGLSQRDVTPEATLSVIERQAPGIAEALRSAGTLHTPLAMLSRGVAGVRGQALIVNLPGSTRGVHDGLEILSRVVDHAHGVLSGAVTQHGVTEESGHGA